MQMSPMWVLLAMFASHFQQPSRRKALEASLCLPKKHLSSLHAVSSLQSPAVFLRSLAAYKKSAQKQGTKQEAYIAFHLLHYYKGEEVLCWSLDMFAMKLSRRSVMR